MGDLATPVIARRRETMEEKYAGFPMGVRNGHIAVSSTSGSSKRFSVLRESYCCHVESCGVGFYQVVVTAFVQLGYSWERYPCFNARLGKWLWYFSRLAELAVSR